MRSRHRSRCRIAACTLVLACAAHARPPVATDLVQDAHVVAAGGRTMSGGPWTLDATIAQPLAGGHAAGAGGWQLRDGFWRASASPGAGERIFADGFDTANGGAAGHAARR